MANNTLIPDWVAPEHIALVWPEGIPAKRDELKDLYSSLIGLIQEHCPEQKIFILATPHVSHEVRDALHPQHLWIQDEKEIQDIWIRDYAPFWKRKSEFETSSVKCLYDPSYIDDEEWCFRENNVGMRIAAGPEAVEFEVDGLEVVTDGGNLTHNGSGFGIMTSRYLFENENIFMGELIPKTKELFGFHMLLFIPVELGDETGHVDGTVRFISEKAVMLSSYPYDSPAGASFIGAEEYELLRKQMDKLEKHLSHAGLEVHRMPNGIPRMEETEGIGSAVGNYMNFLRIGEKVFLPQYGKEEQDRAAVEALVSAGIAEADIVPVPDCNALAELGGVLNCITTHIYNPLM